jgi:hypothetical protein
VGRCGVVFLVAAVGAAGAGSASTLFPQPLHLVRRISDPISRKTTTVDEYCLANRIVSTSGARSVIVDYEKQTITEIDRVAGTYSISSFDDVARANAALAPAAKAAGENAKGDDWTASPLGARIAEGGRPAAAWRFTARDGTMVEVTVDQRITVSREALDALIGAAYPNRRTAEHEAMTRAAGGGAVRRQSESTQSQAASFSLLLDEAITWEVEGSRLTLRNSVISVTTDVAPSDALMIPPGATRVQSPRVAVPRQLEELNRLPNAPTPP